MYPLDKNYGGRDDIGAENRTDRCRPGNNARPGTEGVVPEAENIAALSRQGAEHRSNNHPNASDLRPKYGPNRNRPDYNRSTSPNPPNWGFSSPGNSGGVMSKPSSPPPSKIPVRASKSTRAVDYGSIRMCLFHNTYVWLRNGVAFWFYPVYVSRRSISGFRWTHFGWAYTGIDLSWIDYFECV
ncbi:MAG: hypothetical protein LBS84_07875 [Clostridiales bacterium]|nr:hypothetical protein [Clostridiales bacterium]